MKVPNQKVKKLDNMSNPVIYLGKEPGTKAYRLYDPINKRVLVSRDVIFEEKKQWAWKDDESLQGNLSEMFTVFGAKPVDSEGDESEQNVNYPLDSETDGESSSKSTHIGTLLTSSSSVSVADSDGSSDSAP